MTLKTEEAIKIAEQIQTEIVDGKVSTQNILRRYYSLVTLIKKDDGVEWSTNELFGYKDIEKVPNYRKVTNDQNMTAFIDDGCGIIEAWLLSDEFFIYSPKKRGYFNRIKSEVPVGSENFFYILNTIKSFIYIHTNQILLELKFGKFEFDIFEETRKVVDTELRKRCPKAFEKLSETYEDLMKIETPLDFQQTALACRVILKDFADTIYPASNKKINGFDGKPHTLKDDDYTNRIIACLQESSSSKEDKEFMEDYLKYLESYLVSLNKMANKGLHHENSREYANRCLIYTYLVLGDIIKLLEKQYAPIGI